MAARGAALIAAEARAAVAERGRFALALSGGRTPWAMLSLVASEDVPWHAVDVFQVDERDAPDGHPERNLTHLRAALGPGVRIHPMPVQGDLDSAAAAYGALLPETLDLVQLGLGADGHTASLVPGDPVLDVVDRPVAVTGPYHGRRRLTLTLPTLAGARLVLWVVTGRDKSDALRRLRAGDVSIPATRVRARRQLLLADRSAAESRP